MQFWICNECLYVEAADPSLCTGEVEHCPRCGPGIMEVVEVLDVAVADSEWQPVPATSEHGAYTERRLHGLYLAVEVPFPDGVPWSVSPDNREASPSIARDVAADHAGRGRGERSGRCAAGRGHPRLPHRGRELSMSDDLTDGVIDEQAEAADERAMALELELGRELVPPGETCDELWLADLGREAWERGARPRSVREADAAPATPPDDLHERFLRWRDVTDPCGTCNGSGRRCYPNTSTWRRSMGGASTTTDVCDVCWGTGDRFRTGVDLRRLRDEEDKRVAEAAVDAIAQSCGATLGSTRNDISALADHISEIADKADRARGGSTSHGLSSVFGAPLARALAGILSRAVAR